MDGDGDFDANDSFLIQLARLSGADLQIDQSKGSSLLTASQIRAKINQIGTKADVDGDQLSPVSPASHATGARAKPLSGQCSGNRRTVPDNGNRAANVGSEFLLRIDTNILQERGGQIVGRKASTHGAFCFVVGAANDLTRANCPAGQQCTHRPRPVVSHRVAVDFWGSSKFTSHQNRCGFQ